MSDRPLVLIVDDNPGDVDLISLALEDTAIPLEVVCAYDGKEAVRVLEAMSPVDRRRCRLVLLDLNMPRMSGRDFLAWLRQQAAFKHLPVIILTSSTLPAEKAECLALGANDYWFKEPKYDLLQRQVVGVRRYLVA